MKIGIIAPSPVPFAIGGAENLCWGLLSAINQFTHHQAELIKLPSPEGNFWSLIKSYQLFSRLDLSHFDMVISTKYPSWMVSHPNHVCYMLHRLRGLYDTYHFTGLPQSYKPRHPFLMAIQEFIQLHYGQRQFLDEFFDLLKRLKNAPDIPSDAFSFPGPFIREVIHFMDSIGLSSANIRHFTAISRTVANRTDYFPPDIKADIIYPPSHLPSFRNGNAKYLFTASRLDGPKRIALLIEAMQYVKSTIELRIAGAGPSEYELKELAKDDQRIKFLGFVNDTELIDLYADALVILYVPYDEDYGLITIEAMMSGKPVITTMDSGGPNEFVRNSETGYSTPSDPRAIAHRIDYLCNHKDEARSMGLVAQRSVQNITWGNAVKQLLNKAEQNVTSVHMTKRKKITVTSTFPIFPPRGGGQSRIFHLYRHIAHYFDVDIVSIANADSQMGKAEIASHLWEIRIPKSAAHQKEEWRIEQSVGGIPITDVVMPQLYQLTPAYVAALKESSESSDFIISSHPYLLPAILKVCNKPIFYEAQDVEFELKNIILPATPAGRKLLESTRNVESECCQISKLIMVCSAADGDLLNKIYQADRSKIVEVPNGVDLESVNYTSLNQRIASKRRLGLDKAFIVLFMGSWHRPNIDAVRRIFQFAEVLSSMRFLIVGSVGLAFKDQISPPNVGFMGVVDDTAKDIILGSADVAINPIETGSGTNLKMLDYCAAGVPVLSSPYGVRGLTFSDGIHIKMAEIEQFPDSIRMMKQEFETLGERIEKARSHTATHYDWAIIAKKFVEEIKKRDMI